MQRLTPALLSCALLAPALAQQPATAPVSSIRVSGEAQVSVKPDRVQIDIGVTTRAEKSAEAAAQNARQTEAVLTALKKAGGSTAVLKTVNYSITPAYRYQQGHEPTLTGYTASNVVQVTLDDLARLSDIIDASAQAGANTVRGIAFTLRDQEAVHAEALRKAVARARADVDVLAQALGLKVVRVLSVEETGGRFMPVMRSMAAGANAASADVATPVESGTLDISASVMLSVEVAPAH
ncbi:MAG TPA: SIMPL domain-containing protein [Steroidobacteraceae bacterium]|nr:SIMPL domain-containing protein [Steroidobacteraceae bacterium]